MGEESRACFQVVTSSKAPNQSQWPMGESTVRRTWYKKSRGAGQQRERVAAFINSDLINVEYSQNSLHRLPSFLVYQRSYYGTTDELLDVFGCSITDTDLEPSLEKVRNLLLFIPACRLLEETII